jgi:D-lyxose ketol-isomerase
MNTGKSYRRNKKDLWDMSEFFGEKCMEYGLENSVREEFYNHDLDRQKDKITFAEKKMTERGAETFKEELREVIREEIQNPANRTFDDVVNALLKNWGVETIKRLSWSSLSKKQPLNAIKRLNVPSKRARSYSS